MLVDCEVCEGRGVEDVGGHERGCAAKGCILGKVESLGIVLGRIAVVPRAKPPKTTLCPYSQVHPSGCSCEGLEGI